MKIVVDTNTHLNIRIVEDIALTYKISLLIYCDKNCDIEINYGNLIKIDSNKNTIENIITNSIITNDILITNDYNIAMTAILKHIDIIASDGFYYNMSNINKLVKSHPSNQKDNNTKRKNERRLIRNLNKLIIKNHIH